jgi:hypothetical protein
MDNKPKDSYYFSHDSNARNDKNIIKLRRKLGLEGYGVYWCIIEILREESGHKMQLSCIDDISFQIGAKPELINEVIKSFGLFRIDDDFFYSESLIRRMILYNETKARLSHAGKKGMDARWGKKEDQPTAAPLKRVL